VSVQRILEAFAQGLLVENVHLINFPFRYTATQDLRLRGSVRSKLRRWTSHRNRQTGWLLRIAVPSIFSFLMQGRINQYANYAMAWGPRKQGPPDRVGRQVRREGKGEGRRGDRRGGSGRKAREPALGGVQSVPLHRAPLFQGAPRLPCHAHLGGVAAAPSRG
jgi:hypothetical protein